MNNRENLEFDRLLTCDIRELLAAITPMSADDCEHYASFGGWGPLARAPYLPDIRKDI